eukprot:CAMPEP_0116832602 /NCGR_PEP_ID=MMETSP0418-20121206/5983_1 /TAXON_ID=1158023 /ORGANISM="Astrosyne radiata, Strain 13vi08-1A" /LENGTH=127 /DNA_ID=CAMNT_0004461981 /DNA_START=1036 /DNA_END=1416 /DNA_ORIENTATION=-
MVNDQPTQETQNNTRNEGRDPENKTQAKAIQNEDFVSSTEPEDDVLVIDHELLSAEATGESFSFTAEPMRDDLSTRSRAGWIEAILIFVCGAGATVSWTALLSNFVFYNETLGSDSYLLLNIMVYGP